MFGLAECAPPGGKKYQQFGYRNSDMQSSDFFWPCAGILFGDVSPCQALGNKTPDEVYQSASGGGAMIADKYDAKKRIPVALRSSGTALRKGNLEKNY